MAIAAIIAKVVTYFHVIVKLLPSVIQAILALEAAWPGAGQGNAKREMLKAALQAAFEVVEDGQVSFAEIWPIIEKLIGIQVATFNDKGWPQDPAAPSA